MMGAMRQEIERRPVLTAARPVPITRLQTTATTIATARADADLRINSLFAANMTGAGATITLHIVAEGDAASDANMILSQYTVAARDRAVLFALDYEALIDPGASLVGLCGSNNAIHVYGVGFDYRGEYGV